MYNTFFSLYIVNEFHIYLFSKKKSFKWTRNAYKNDAFNKNKAYEVFALLTRCTTSLLLQCMYLEAKTLD